VEDLDRFIIGQKNAKRAVAVSLRNRWRRQQLDETLKKEVLPMNILMMGPTGTGKTEIARRLAQLVDAPFAKVEATKYTEIGIVGQSAEDCVKDLVDRAIKMEKEKRIEKLKSEIDTRVIDHILKRIPGSSSNPEEYKKRLKDGEFENTKIEVASFRLEPTNPFANIFKGSGAVLNFMSSSQSNQKKSQNQDKDRVPISEAREIIREYELSKSIDEHDIRRVGIKRAEESGIIFLDEIDKLCSDHVRSDYKGVKGEGVQKELLGLLEGTTVQTDYGIVHTDHILFICAGAFHHAKPSDLLPELQGRLPIRVELVALTEEDFKRILTETENNLIKQQKALFSAEGVELDVASDAIDEIAKIAKQLNENLDNIGARRLRAVISKIVEELSYNAPDRKGDKIVIDAKFVKEELKELLQNEDLSRYIL